MPTPDDGGIRVLPETGREPGPAPRRRRRSRRLGTALAVAAAVALLAAAALVDRGPRPERAILAVPSIRPLPRLATELPRLLDPRRGTVLPLSAHPIGRARLLLEPDNSPEIYALAEDNTWRHLDVVRILPTSDEHGNPQRALDVTSLSADGQRAAFAQRDEVVVISLATAAVRRIPVPGFNEDVRWVGDELVVRQRPRTVKIDGDGVVVPIDDDGLDLVVGDDEQTVLRLDATYRPVMHRPSTGTRTLDGVGNLATWTGPGWQRDGTIARTALESTGTPDAPTGPPRSRIVLIDVASRTARFAPDRRTVPLTNSQLLGWRNSSTVLLLVWRQGLVAFDITTGAVSTVADIGGTAGLSVAGIR